MKKILNTLDIDNIPEFSDVLSKYGRLINIQPERKAVLNEIKDAYAYISSASVKVDEEFLEKANNLKVIGSPSTGTDHLDLELIKKNIVCYDISKEFKLINTFTATSELVFSLLLSLLRNIVPAVSDAKNGKWAREKYSGRQLFGKNFGIIGLGRLGIISARIANGFGMNVMAYDIHDKDVENVTMVDMDTLAKKSDFISIHVHLNKFTEGMINKDFFINMRDTGIIINTSRGKIINESDLLFALENKLIYGAGLDVIDGEWLTEKEIYNHPLIKFSRENNNLLITPHVGGATRESIVGSRIFMAEKVAAYLKNNI